MFSLHPSIESVEEVLRVGMERLKALAFILRNSVLLLCHHYCLWLKMAT